MKIADQVRADPIGSAIAALLPVFIALIILTITDDGPVREYLPDPTDIDAPLPPPDPAWLAAASPEDIFALDGIGVPYWGRTDTRYSSSSDRPERYTDIVVHYTLPRPIIRLVQYQHNGDKSRGGGHFGYHLYVDHLGRVVQGAPLTMRTNHVKPPGHRSRKAAAPWISNRNAIGVTMVGACVPLGQGFATRCQREELTAAQQESGLAVIRALMLQYKIPCTRVWGHGDLQIDRADFEGSTLRAIIRSGC